MSNINSNPFFKLPFSVYLSDNAVRLISDNAKEPRL